MAVEVAALVAAAAATGYGAAYAQPHGAGGHGNGDAHVGRGEAEHEHRHGSAVGKVAGALLIPIAGLALVPLSIVARRRDPRGAYLARPSAAAPAAPWPPLLAGVAALSAGAALIHFAAIAPHFDEWWPTGLFFLLLAPLQLAWAILVLVRPSRPLLVAAAAGSLLVAAVWVVTRTGGLPVGPEAGDPEPVGLADGIATIYELLLAFGALALLRPLHLRRLRPLVGPAACLAAGAVFVAATALSLLSLVEL